GTVTPVGAPTTTAVDVRLVTARHRDLSQMVHDGTFREDLFQRLRGYLIRTPALSQHPEDVPLLAARFWALACGDRPGRLPDDVLGLLTHTDWPGNARELKSCLGGLRFNYPTIDVPDLALVQDWLVEWRQGHPERRPGRPRQISTWLVAEQIERLEVLRVSNKILRDCKVAVRPFAVHHRADPATLASIRASLTKSLDELERLTRDPNWFRSWEAHDLVRHVKGQYTTFVSLLERHPRKALKLWDDELLREQAAAARKLSDVRREVEEIVLRHGELGDERPTLD
ncbi:MAG: sigma 54-interacting transcriptional regulator, partial [Gemmatimonadales bacterium]